MRRCHYRAAFYVKYRRPNSLSPLVVLGVSACVHRALTDANQLARQLSSFSVGHDYEVDEAQPTVWTKSTMVAHNTRCCHKLVPIAMLQQAFRVLQDPFAMVIFHSLKSQLDGCTAVARRLSNQQS